MNYDFISKIYNKRTIDKIQSKIDNLGSLNKLTTKTFLKKRLIISIIIFFLSLYIFDYGYVIGPILTFVYYVMYERIILDKKTRENRR